MNSSFVCDILFVLCLFVGEGSFHTLFWSVMFFLFFFDFYETLYFISLLLLLIEHSYLLQVFFI